MGVGLPRVMLRRRRRSTILGLSPQACAISAALTAGMLARLRDELRKAYAVIMALEAQARPSTRGLPALLHRCGMALARRLARPRFSLRMRPCSAALGMAGEAASRGPVPRKVGYSLTYKRPCDLDLQVPGSTPAFFKGVLQDHAFCLFCGAVTNASAEPGNTVRDKVSHRAALLAL